MIAGLLSWLLGTSTGRYVLVGVAGVLLATAVLLYVYGQGEAAGAAGVTAAALAEAARRAREAQKAREAVKHDQDAIDRDEFNRDRK